MYAKNQLNSIKKALSKFQQKDDSKAAFVLVLTYSSGQVCTIMMASLLIQSKINGSSLLVLNFFMTRRILRKYSTISWPFPLSKVISLQDHSLTWFKVWVLRRLNPFGLLRSPLCVGIRADLGCLATITKVHQSPSIRLLFSTHL